MKQGFWQESKESGIAFSKWLLLALMVGLTVGVVGWLFRKMIEWATELRLGFPWLLWLLPVAGLAIVWTYRVCGVEKDRGTNLVLVAVRENEPMPLRMAPLIMLATTLTHLCGGSSGREGAALQMGGAISGTLGRMIHLDEKDERIITMCGMAAGFSALFGTPLAAAVFAMEVVSVGVMYYAAIVPCVLAAVIASMLVQFLGIPATQFVLMDLPALHVPAVLRVLVLGALCAFVAILFSRAFGITQRLYAHLGLRPYVRVALGGAIVIVLSLLVQTTAYNGAGLDGIAAALMGDAAPQDFILKILFSAVTLTAGFKGGEIVPSFFVGATFGCFYGGLLGLSPSFAAGIGMVSVFCGLTNCPLTSILLAFELFGGEGLPLFALACAVSYMLSGTGGLYSEQKIMYSKLRPEFIDRKSGE